MMNRILLASAAALCVAVPARAANEIQRTRIERQALPDEVVEVQSQRPSPMGTILVDTIGGGVLGAAAGGGVALYEHSQQSNNSWPNWERDLLVGGGIGLAAGLVFGLIDSASQPSTPSTSTVVTKPVSDRRESGFEPPLALISGRF